MLFNYFNFQRAKYTNDLYEYNPERFRRFNVALQRRENSTNILPNDGDLDHAVRMIYFLFCFTIYCRSNSINQKETIVFLFEGKILILKTIIGSTLPIEIFMESKIKKKTSWPIEYKVSNKDNLVLQNAKCWEFYSKIAISMLMTDIGRRIQDQTV